MEHASLLAMEVIKAARRWVASRVALRRVMDSKSATNVQVNKAREQNQRAAEELEVLVMRFERFLHNSGQAFPMKRGKKASTPFPWRELFGAIGAVARGAENVLEGKPPVVNAKVIDMEPDK